MKRIPKQDLEAYIEVSDKLREAAKLKEELRRRILQCLDSGMSAPSGYAVIAERQQRTSVPWQEEAHRWQQIARDYATRLGIPPSEFARHYVEYPPSEVVILRVSRKA